MLYQRIEENLNDSFTDFSTIQKVNSDIHILEPRQLTTLSWIQFWENGLSTTAINWKNDDETFVPITLIQLRFGNEERENPEELGNWFDVYSSAPISGAGFSGYLDSIALNDWDEGKIDSLPIEIYFGNSDQEDILTITGTIDTSAGEFISDTSILNQNLYFKMSQKQVEDFENISLDVERGQFVLKINYISAPQPQ